LIIPQTTTILNVIIYQLVGLTVYFEKHYLVTHYIISKIIKLTILLLFNTVIGPYSSFLASTISSSNEENIFDSYFFFNIISNNIFNYLISVLFLSNIISFLPILIIDPIKFLFYLMYSRIKHGKFIKPILERREFPFEERYIILLTIFCLLISYGLSIPIIILPGLIFFILFFIFDRILLIYFYKKVILFNNIKFIS
jgi:hypothetical protein